MQNSKEVVPFYKVLMQTGVFGCLATIVATPRGEAHFLGLYWSYTGLLFMASIALFVFGFVFGLLAGISARRAHVVRMQEAAAQASAGDASASEFPADAVAVTSSAAPVPAPFASPEPRVLVVDNVVKPNMEFPSSLKA